MTKTQLEHLILLGKAWVAQDIRQGELPEYYRLCAEFAQWDPDAIERERDEARLQRDNTQALVIKIGLRLREHYRDEWQGWEPGVAAEIYGWIDQLVGDTSS